GGILEQPELTRGQRLMIAATWKQPAVLRRDAGVIIRGRPRLPPLPQQLEDLRRQLHVPVLAALRPHDADDHLLTVDVARSQPHHLASPQLATKEAEIYTRAADRKRLAEQAMSKLEA